MQEMSYADAVESGIEPITYRGDALDAIGEGSFSGQLDALVWAKRSPCLMALITLDLGARVQVLGFKRHTRKELPEYLGLRELSPGQRVTLHVDRGLRGGLRPLVMPAGTVASDLPL